jgi:ribosome-binding protein aMBF1 (putative translation factor)
MRSRTPISPDDRRRRRLANAELTPAQKAVIEARRAERRTVRYQLELKRDIEAYRQEYKPARDPELIEALARLRRQRKQQGLSLTDMAERTGIDRATISKLETGKIANPTIGTLRTYARALGRRLVWTVELVANEKRPPRPRTRTR